MKRSYWGVIALCLVLLGNIALTQYAVNMYYYEKYGLTILFALLNVALFPVAVYIYRKGGKYG
jgi:hypothetical protein